MIRKILSALGIIKKTKTNKSSVYEVTPPIRTIKNRNNEIDAFIIDVAKEFENEERFRSKAKSIALKLDIKKAESLTNYFHDYPPIPENLESITKKYGLLSSWMEICQDSIFEILYNFKELAIPKLYAIGFGEYDWTQYKAIEVLCRFASEGIQTTEIVDSIYEEIGDFREEAVFPTLKSLARIRNNEKVPEILLAKFEEYIEYDPIDGLQILIILADNYSTALKDKFGFLKDIAKGVGIEDRTPFDDGAVVQIDKDGKESYWSHEGIVEENSNEMHRINAAILCHQIDKEDSEIIKLLQYWMNNAKNESDRITVKELMENK